MNVESFTKPVKRPVKVLVVNQVSLKSMTKIIHIEVFSNRQKLFAFFNELGTMYAIKKGRELRRPLLTYKTFAQYLQSCDAQFIHVASTGYFAGSYLVQIITVK